MIKKNISLKTSKREFLHGRLLGNVLYTVFLFMIYAPSPTLAQWRKVAQLNSLINTIFFNNEINGNLGLITTGRTGNDFALWRTSDGGGTWTQIKSIIGPASDFAFSDFTFKDAFTGWMSVRSSFGPLKTTDGGITWSSQSLPNTAHGGIFYNKGNKVLIQNGGGYASGNSFISTDEGLTWKMIPLGCDQGFSFFSTMQGVSGCSDAEITSDGGFTWQSVSNVSECYQPLALKNTSKCFFLSEASKLLYLSVDFGQSFSVRYDFTSFGTSLDVVTGCIRGDTNLLLIQSLLNGAFYSLNDGLSWINFCGPKNVYDTRFFVKGDSVFMGDTVGGLWLNTTGIGSNSTPQLSFNKIILSSPGCEQFDTAITFTFFDSCNGIQANFLSASIQGTPSFSFTSPSAIPRIIHSNDSLIISYHPQTSSPDTAALHLRFHLGWKDFDTVIQLFGSGRIPKENVQFIPSLSANSASPGKLINLFVKPDKSISGKGLQSISFDLNYYGDLLNATGNITTSIANATISNGTITHSGKTETLPITITGNDLTLDPAKSIAAISFMPMVTLGTTTAITITNLKLNNGDADFANCILSANSPDTTFSLIPECGDSTLRQFMRTGKVLDITSIRPNPGQDEIEIELRSGLNQDVSIEIYNALGVRVLSESKNMTNGLNQFHLDTKGLASGMYLVRVGSESQSLVISR